MWRAKRELKEWLRSASKKEVRETLKRADEGVTCSRCSAEKGVYWFELKYGFHVYCKPCLEAIKNEEDSQPKDNSRLSLRFRILERDRFTCVYCGRNPKDDGVKLEVDHIIPKAMGGKDIPENLVTACRDCNQGKKDFLTDTIIQYAKRP